MCSRRLLSLSFTLLLACNHPTAAKPEPVAALTAHLDSPADQLAFRQWFTFLAEAQYFRQPLPREVNDCAALIRYAYREALSPHNDEWIAAARLPFVPAFPAIAKYTFPRTPTGPNLFRISESESAQFADAETLLRFNAHLMGRDIEQAEPGDILWFHQLSQPMPFHTMVYLGVSQLDGTRGPYVVYHTGPGGEIRRLTVAELQRHPDQRWRPLSTNSNFLGVYRWDIL